MRLAGVVVLYHPTEDDINNINSYIDDLEILFVIDNTGKEDGIYVPYLKKNNKVRYINFNENMGVSKALNLGAELARKEGIEWLLTMDQDTKFKKNVLSEMCNYLSKNNIEDVGLVTPWHKTKLLENKSNLDIDYPKDVMTSGNLINLEIHKKIGGYDNRYFIDGIDIDYCLNLRMKGYKIVRLNYLVIDHDLGDIKIRNFLGRTYESTNHNYIRNYYMQRNYRYIYEKYHDFDPEFCEILIHFKSIIFKIIMFEKDKYRKIRNIYRGILDYKKKVIGKYPYKD